MISKLALNLYVTEDDLELPQNLSLFLLNAVWIMLLGMEFRRLCEG